MYLEDYDADGDIDVSVSGFTNDQLFLFNNRTINQVDGCTDTYASNYNPDATDIGNCEYPEEYYDCLGLCLNDNDGDGICNQFDNCPLTYNPDQTDDNNDSIGDACDGISLDENSHFEWNIYPNPFKSGEFSPSTGF